MICLYQYLQWLRIGKIPPCREKSCFYYGIDSCYSAEIIDGKYSDVPGIGFMRYLSMKDGDHHE